MTEHELEVAAQTAVDVVAEFTPALKLDFKCKPTHPGKSCSWCEDETYADALKRRILTKLKERFEFSPDDIDWGDVEP